MDAKVGNDNFQVAHLELIGVNFEYAMDSMIHFNGFISPKHDVNIYDSIDELPEIGMRDEFKRFHSYYPPHNEKLAKKIRGCKVEIIMGVPNEWM